MVEGATQPARSRAGEELANPPASPARERFGALQRLAAARQGAGAGSKRGAPPFFVS